MSVVHRTVVVAMAALLFAAPFAAAGAPPSLEESLRLVRTYQVGESRRPLRVIEEHVVASLDDGAGRRALEAQLVEIVGDPESTAEGRSFVCRLLAIIGTRESVPALAALLDDPRLSHMARYALQAIPDPAVDRALQRSLEELDGDLRIGVINTLAARRRGPSLVHEDPDAEQVRYAALWEAAQRNPTGSVPVILDELDRGDAAWRASIARIIVETPGAEATEAYAARLPGLGPGLRLVVIDALARRGDPIAGPYLSPLLEYGGGTERDAVLAALAIVGTTDDVEVLLALAAEGSAGARKALERMPSRDVDAALAGAVERASTGELVVIARVLGARRSGDQGDVLVGLAEQAGPSSVRTAACLSLASLGPSEPGVDPDAWYRTAMMAANAPAEKQWVLTAFEESRSARHLPLALRWLTDDDVGPDAARVILMLAGEVDPVERGPALAAIDRVMQAYPDDEEIHALAGAAVSHLEREDGFIRTWEMAGPYHEEGVGGQSLFGVVFPPEPEASPDGVEWRPVPADAITRPGIVDLGKALGGDNRAAYLRTVLRSDRARQVRFELGSDDGLKVWLNDEPVHANDVMRGLTPGQDVVVVTLRKGANTLLVKVNQGGGGWQGCCRVRDADGFKVTGVQAELAN